MSVAAQQTIKARHAALMLFERELRKTNSEMAAYENVAAMVGASAGWIRKFIKGYSEVKQPDWTVGWNILAHYARICERIENNNAQRRKNIARIEERLNEAAARSNSGIDTPEA